jgi:hypothetical protein
MIKFRHTGSFNLLERFLANAIKLQPRDILESYGEIGVAALAAATPIDTGVTAASWSYTITTNGDKGARIDWTNSSEDNGVPVAILIQYGHGTASGAYVEGRDFINPAIQPILDKMAQSLWEEVIKV